MYTPSLKPCKWPIRIVGYSFILALTMARPAAGQPAADSLKILIEKGHQYLSQQDFMESKKYYTRALELSEKSGNAESLLESLESMAWFYHDLGNFRSSDEFFNRALHYARSLGHEEKAVKIRAALGSNLLSVGQYASAQKEYFYAADYFKKKKDMGNYAFYLSTGANLYRHLNQPDKAGELLQEAYLRQKEIRDTSGVITTSRFLGMLYTEQGEFDEAENYLLESLDLARKRKNYLFMIKSYYTLERLYYSRGDLKNGDKYQKAVIRLRDSLYSAENNKALAEFDIKYSTAQKEKALAESRLEVNRKQNWIIVLTLALLSFLVSGLNYLRIRRIKQRASMQEAEIEKQGAILKARDLERKRIAQELHDSVGSQLTVVSTGLDNAFFLATNQQLMPEKLETLNEEIRAAAQSLRDTIWATYNFSIPASNLYSRMQSYLNKIREQGGVSIRSGLQGDDLPLNSLQALHIFRIFQEAVQNTLKHARASEIFLAVSLGNSTFRMEISDNGKGFSLSSIPTNERFGLQNMQARCAEINAGIKIDSAVNEGTCISLYLENVTSPS